MTLVTRIFTFFWDFFSCKPLRLKEKRRAEPSKKIVPKTYRGFFPRPGMCLNDPMYVEMTCRDEGCEAKREASWSAERQFRFRTPRWKAALARPRSKTRRLFGRPSKSIRSNQAKSNPGRIQVDLG